MIGYYNKSVIVTYIALICAVFGMYLAMTGAFQAAFIVMMFCGMCDMIDGPIARRCKRTDDEKSFGIQIDSLCDLICFGAFPSIVMLCKVGIVWWVALIAAFYTLAGVIRLGFFNVQEMNRVQSDPGRRKTYDGVPITTGSLVMPIIAAVDVVVGGLPGYIYAAFMAFTGLMFIMPVRIPKFHMKGLTVLTLIGLAAFVALIACGKTLNTN